MFQNKTISVAMPSYNGARFIKEQVKSICEQTVRPDEIIISDDGSADGTQQIVTELAAEEKEKGTTITLLSDNPTKGPSFNLVWALKHCHGDYIFFADQDDIWLPDKVETVIGTFLDHPGSKLVFHDASSVDKDGHPIDETFNPFIKSLQNRYRDQKTVLLPREDYLAQAVSAPVVHGMVQCIERQFLDETVFPFPPISCDSDAWTVVCALACNGCVFVDRVLTYRRLHDNNASGEGAGQMGLFKRLGKIRGNVARHNSDWKLDLIFGSYLTSFLKQHCQEGTPGLRAAKMVAARTAEIGRKEWEAGTSGRITGAWKLSKLFLTDRRYRGIGTKRFLYQLLEIVMVSKKDRLARMDDGRDVG